MTIGERIQMLRRQKNLSQEALGEALGVSRQAISKWESDLTIPEVEKLIALSRLFGVPVGVLLGVEEQGEDGDDRRDAREELTERELRALEELLRRYAQESERRRPAPPPRRRWPVVLGIIVAAFLLANTFERLRELERQLGDLRYSVQAIDQTVAGQLAGLPGRVEEILRQQNDLLASEHAEVASIDLSANTVTFSLSATPRRYVEGMAVEFLAAGPELETVTVAGVPDAGQNYSANLTCSLTNEITLSAVLVADGVRETKELWRLEGAEWETRPDFSFSDYQLSHTVKNGVCQLQGSAAILWHDAMYKTTGGAQTVLVEELSLRVYRNGERVETVAADLSQDGREGIFHNVTIPIDLSFEVGEEEAEVWLVIFAVDQFGRTTRQLAGQFYAQEDGRLPPAETPAPPVIDRLPE